MSKVGIKSLESLIELCKKHGVKRLEHNGVTIEMGEQPVQIPPELENTLKTAKESTDEDILFDPYHGIGTKQGG